MLFCKQQSNQWNGQRHTSRAKSLWFGRQTWHLFADTQNLKKERLKKVQVQLSIDDKISTYTGVFRACTTKIHTSFIPHPSNIQLIDTDSDRFYLLNSLYYLCELFGANNLIVSKQYSGSVVILSRHIVCITDLEECISCWTKLLFWMKWELAIAFEYQSCTEYVSDVLKSLTKVETFKSLWLCGECFFLLVVFGVYLTTANIK